MCTLTWWREGADSYEVFFNRDEKKSRSLAEPPRLRREEGLSFLAPRDPDGGGSWMLANERGLLVCLLNRWHEDRAVGPPALSRGQLVMKMATAENVPAVEELLHGEDLVGVRPFTMVGFDPVGERAWTWNGRALGVERAEMPMCSSSFHYEEVDSARRDRFRELGCQQRAGADLLESYHADTGAHEEATAFTIRMCRPDAQTMSRSRVRVGKGRVRWTYLEEQQDLAGPPRLFEAAL